MRRFQIACAIMALGLTAPVLAQTTAPAESHPTMPSNQPMPSDPTSSQTQSNTMSSPNQGDTTTADLTGQAIYSAKGEKIGTVSSMKTDAKGQQAASVTMGKYMGMGGQTILVPVSSLQARSSGGYTTNLSAAELKSLAKSGTSHMQ
jgi:hypothetical protein